MSGVCPHFVNSSENLRHSHDWLAADRAAICSSSCLLFLPLRAAGCASCLLTVSHLLNGPTWDNAVKLKGFQGPLVAFEKA
jgi:hypothetical protein